MRGSYRHVKEILALHERGLSHTCSDCNIKNTKPFPNVRKRLFVSLNKIFKDNTGIGFITGLCGCYGLMTAHMI